MKPPEVSVLDVVRRRAEFTLMAVPQSTQGYVRLGDAVTDVSQFGRRFHWVITSPPYYGMRTYGPDQWLEIGSSVGRLLLGTGCLASFSTPGSMRLWEALPRCGRRQRGNARTAPGSSSDSELCRASRKTRVTWCGAP